MASRDIGQLKERIAQTMDTLNNFLDMDPRTHWYLLMVRLICRPAVLNTFTLLISKYAALVQDVSRSSAFVGYIVFPLNLLKEDADFAPRVLLRSKPIPELEVSLPRLDINALDEQSIAKAFNHHQALAIDHDALVESALTLFEEVREEYDFKTRIASNLNIHSVDRDDERARVLASSLRYMNMGD